MYETMYDANDSWIDDIMDFVEAMDHMMGEIRYGEADLTQSRYMDSYHESANISEW